MFTDLLAQGLIEGLGLWGCLWVGSQDRISSPHGGDKESLGNSNDRLSSVGCPRVAFPRPVVVPIFSGFLRSGVWHLGFWHESSKKLLSTPARFPSSSDGSRGTCTSKDARLLGRAAGIRSSLHFLHAP